MESAQIGADLLELKRDMLWRKLPVGEGFHAAPDKQAVRDEVFALLQKHDFTIQATIMEKSKAQPQVTASKARFYKIGWLYHLRHGISGVVKPDTELLVTAAAVEKSKKHQAHFTSAINDVVQQTIPRDQWATSFCLASSDPCLQVADYCTWAMQRKWEQNDTRSYDLIKSRITYEYDLWKRGSKHHY